MLNAKKEKENNKGNFGAEGVMNRILQGHMFAVQKIGNLTVEIFCKLERRGLLTDNKRVEYLRVLITGCIDRKKY